MSVLVKGMEMPETCAECDFCGGLISYNTYFCECPSETMFGKDIGKAIEEDRRHTDCPLVEVPTPHGRLIDADDVFHVLTSYYHHSTDFQHEALKEALARVSTIIEEEGGDGDV